MVWYGITRTAAVFPRRVNMKCGMEEPCNRRSAIQYQISPLTIKGLGIRVLVTVGNFCKYHCPLFDFQEIFRVCERNYTSFILFGRFFSTGKYWRLKGIAGRIYSDVDTLTVAAWFSGIALDSINEVTLRRAPLVLGWVNACGRVNHIGLWPATEANSAQKKTNGEENEYRQKCSYALRLGSKGRHGSFHYCMIIVC